MGFGSWMRRADINAINPLTDPHVIRTIQYYGPNGALRQSYSSNTHEWFETYHWWASLYVDEMHQHMQSMPGTNLLGVYYADPYDRNVGVDLGHEALNAAAGIPGLVHIVSSADTSRRDIKLLPNSANPEVCDLVFAYQWLCINHQHSPWTKVEAREIRVTPSGVFVTF